MPGVDLLASVGVVELAEQLGGTLDPELAARRVARVAEPGADTRESDLVVVASARWVPPAAAGRGVLLCTPGLASRLPEGRRFRHEHPLWVMATLLAEVAAERMAPPSSRDAVVAVGAEVDPSARVRPGAVVQTGVSIGPHSVIGENAVVCTGSSIGARVVIGPNAVIGRPGFGWAPGPEGRVRRIPQLGGVVIEDDVEIGALSTVDAGTLSPTFIGTGAKLDAHVHVGHNVRIHAGCLVAAQVGFAGSVELGEGAIVGGQAGFKDHVSVGAGASVAAKSGVIGDIPAGATVAGFPAVSRWRWLRGMAALLSSKRS
ncbi:MAG: UDP-3-O-(3-hydroxymyristoyl)glucosamine N-acyltransferase [Myxococcales bacterium]|nr:UDP-3-O-(3-hydroxymyristoyl)glucosamine N-acyltransferase [Myxococcales bacterium]MCB9581459.1 UDP-3-O-(3-hydroxymyristoyl)glucosamine N-acyltransferase [Polyangiaceae bacterium]